MGERIALGFCNNVDYEIKWNADVLEDLIRHYRISCEELTTRADIKSERDLVISILGFMSAAEGGERFVANSELIERFAARFEKNITLGGTSVRAAIAMRRLGYTSALHLITQNDHVRRLIPGDSPYVCSNAADSAHPHLIVQFDGGDRLRVGDIEISARQPNRLIYHCNADRIALKINEDFANLIADAQVLLISGFNAMQDTGLIARRLEAVLRILEKLPQDATVYLEDGSYYDPAFRQLVHRGLGDRIDVFSLNEDELQSHLKRKVALLDDKQICAALADLHRDISAASIVLHTQYWALAQGEDASQYAEALRAGVNLATARFRFGDDFTEADYRDMCRRAPGEAAARFADAINSRAGDHLLCVPVPKVEQSNATTIGLGDAFVGGFLPKLLT